MKSAAQWLNDPEIYATSAMAILIEEFGTEFLEWEPETIDIEIQKTFGFDPDTQLMDRLNAAIGLLTSNSFFLDPNAFMNTCNALNFGVVLSESWVPADLDDVLWGVTEAQLLLGDDYKADEYSHNVRRYVGVLLQEEGIGKIPRVLSFAEQDDAVEDTYDSFDGDAVMDQAFQDSQESDRANMEGDNATKLQALQTQLMQLPIKSELLESMRG